MGERLWEGAGPDMSGPYRAAMMLRLRCHERLRGVGDAAPTVGVGVLDDPRAFMVPHTAREG